MTFKRPAYEEVTIAHGDHAVTLRPSLRAATILEQRHGLPALWQALDDQNYTIIHEIILTAATSRQDAAAFLSGHAGRPLLPFFLAVRQPLADLVSMFVPAPDPKVKPSPQIGKPVTWAEVYAALYDRATGWLGWTPEQAWSATPTEIDRAYAAHIEKPKAIATSGEAKPAPDPEQAARNEALGLDPEFDRAGLRALKARIAGERR